ncbi:Zinc finger C2H2 superfamily [Sergentomyia squamirostris]
MDDEYTINPTGGGNCGGGSVGVAQSSVMGGGSRLSLPLPLTACHRCDVCGKLLSTKLTLKRHKEQQHLQPLNNAVCNLCHKVFRTLNSLNNHKSIYHRRQKHPHHHANQSSQQQQQQSHPPHSSTIPSAASIANPSLQVKSCIEYL